MVQVINTQPVSRITRSPAHPWQVRTKPFQIQPVCLAPVLPGETLKSAFWQSRVVTDPIKNALVGWHAEYYWFYVKHRDLEEPFRTTLQSMMLDMSTSTAPLKAGAANDKLYTFNGAMNWTLECLKRCVAEYFRDEGDAWDIQLIGGIPAAKLVQNNWMDSITTTMPDGGDIDPTNTDNTTVAQLDAMYQQWEFLRANELVNMSYEDYLRTYGVRKATVEIHKPELLRMSKEWSYPSNTIDPATGAPSSAVSWSVAGRIDKDRFFKEPGFVLGLSCVRPKVYLGSQKGSAAGLMDNAFRWLPAIMRDEVYTSLVQIAAGSGPIAASSAGHWIDMRDLLLYGDQFLNYATTDAASSIVALPVVSTLKWRYANDAMVDALFVDSGNGKNLVKQDGVIQFNILGTQRDYS